MGTLKNTWNSLFRRSSKKSNETFKPYDINAWTYRAFNRQAIEMDIVRGTVDALSRNIAKMRLQAVMVKADGTKIADNTSDVARVLNHPNQFMTSYDFMYKVSSLYFGS